LKTYIPQMESAVRGCKSSPYYDVSAIDCSILDHITDSDDIDLSDVARDSAPATNQKEVGTSPRIGVSDRK